jgi:hypothetical protein
MPRILAEKPADVDRGGAEDLLPPTIRVSVVPGYTDDILRSVRQDFKMDHASDRCYNLGA